MTEDDWEPLPADQRGMHPGEFANVAKRPAEAAPVPPPAAPEAPAPAPRDEAAAAAAERALAVLKDKLAHAAPATSLIAEAQHRQQREARKKKGVQAAAVRALARHVATVDELGRKKEDGAAPPAPEVEIDTNVADIDPRETEPWFGELPKKERELLRTHWWYERHRGDDAGARLRRRVGRAFGFGAVLCFVLALVQSPWFGSFTPVPMLAATGAIGAAIAEICGGGRIRYGIAGAAAFVAVMGGQLVASPNLLFSMVIMTYGMATLGMDGEMRRSGGFGDR